MGVRLGLWGGCRERDSGGTTYKFQDLYRDFLRFLFCPFPFPRTDFLENKKTEPEGWGQGRGEAAGRQAGHRTCGGTEAGGLQGGGCGHSRAGDASMGWLFPFTLATWGGTPSPGRGFGWGAEAPRPPCSWWRLAPGSCPATLYKSDPEGRGWGRCKR